MNALPHVREALRTSIADIEPRSFNEHLHSRLDDRPLTPAVVTVTTGRAIDGSADTVRLSELGIGVQLGYEGLNLTRSLIDSPSWIDRHETTDADVDVLAAEVLVARGFNILADTGTVDDAVEIVRRFGQRRADERGDRPPRGSSLEHDIIRLAVDTGADCVLSTVPPPVSAAGRDLAERLDANPMPEPEGALVGFARAVDQAYQLHEPPSIDGRSSSSTVDP